MTAPEGVKNAMAQVTVLSIDATARAERLFEELKRKRLIPTLIKPNK